MAAPDWNGEETLAGGLAPAAKGLAAGLLAPATGLARGEGGDAKGLAGLAKGLAGCLAKGLAAGLAAAVAANGLAVGAALLLLASPASASAFFAGFLRAGSSSPALYTAHSDVHAPRVVCVSVALRLSGCSAHGWNSRRGGLAGDGA